MYICFECPCYYYLLSYFSRFFMFSSPTFLRYSKALLGDIGFELPDFFQRGAGDTYFSGKYLAKLARILLISEEVHDLCAKVCLSNIRCISLSAFEHHSSSGADFYRTYLIFDFDAS